MKKLLVMIGAGTTIVALHVYAFGASKQETPIANHKGAVPFASEPASVKNNLPIKEVKPALQAQKSMPVDHSNLPATVNFQMQMAQISQKVFSGFDQADLMNLTQAIDSALNEALTTDDFDKAIGKLEIAVNDLAAAFGANIELTKNLNTKLKNAIQTGFTEFDALVRSGKISNLTGEIYLARILKAALNGLKAGFAKASIMPENTPVPSAVTTPTHVPESASHVAPQKSKVPVSHVPTPMPTHSEPIMPTPVK